jgi:hypothetical protein
MSFSRINYDNDAYKLKVERTTGPGDYRLFMGYNESCNKCYPMNGPNNAKSDVSITDQWGGMAELESHLTNRVNKLVEDNQFGKNDDYKKIQVHHKKLCPESIAPEDTRFTNPIESYRSMDTTEYKYNPFLHVNGQCEIQEDRIGVNSRLKAKDSFANLVASANNVHAYGKLATIIRPTPLDQTLALPPQTSDFSVDICKNF